MTRRGGRLGAILAGLLSAASIVLPGAALARPADVDPSFSNVGLAGVFTDEGDVFGTQSIFRDVIELGDGSIVAAGESSDGFLVAKFTPDGALDSSFGGGDGAFVGAFAFDNAAASRVVALNDGRLLVAGEAEQGADNRAFLTRLTAAGAIDQSFPSMASFNKYVTPLGALNVDRVGGLAVNQTGPNADDKIYFSALGAGPGNEFIVARLSPNGAPDPGFSGDGIATPAIAGTNTVGELVLDDHGIPLAMGSGPGGTFVARFDDAGDLDANYNDNGPDPGVATTPLDTDSLGGMAIDAQNRVIAGAGGGQFEVTRLDEEGEVDTSFSPSPPAGVIEFAPFGLEPFPTDLAVMPGGEITVAGYDPTDDKSIFGRLTAAGEPDTEFATGGAAAVEQNFGLSTETRPNAIVPVTSTKVVVAGAENDDMPLDDRALLVRLGSEGDSPIGDLQLTKEIDDGRSYYRPGTRVIGNSSASQDLDGTIVKREYSINDGVFVQGGTTHVFTLPQLGGSQAEIIRLNVRLTDDDNHAVVVQREVEVRPVAGPKVGLKVIDGNTSIGKTDGRYFVPVNRAVRFDARTSEDPDGTIVKYEWAQPGAGFQPLGDNPSFTFDTPGVTELQLRLTDDEGIQTTETIPIEVAPPLCETTRPEVKVGQVVAKANCFTFLKKGKNKEVYTTPQKATINGIGLTVIGAGPITITATKSGSSVSVDVDVPSAIVRGVGAGDTPVETQSGGKVDWTVDSGGKLTGLKVAPNATLGTIRLLDVTAAKLSKTGIATLTLKPELPAEFGGRVPDKQPLFELGSSEAQSSGVLEPFSFEVKNVPLDPVWINLLKIEYQGNGNWLFEGRGELTDPMAIGICGQVRILNGAFASAHLEATLSNEFGNSCPNGEAGPDGLQVMSQVFISRITGDLEFLPEGYESKCVRTGVDIIDMSYWRDVTGLGFDTIPDIAVDYGYPTSAFCVSVNFNLGPKVLGIRLAKGFIKAGFAAYKDPKPDVFFAKGGVDILGDVLTGRPGSEYDVNASVEIWTNGYLDVRADGFLNFEDLVTLDGRVIFEARLSKKQFDAWGWVQACVGDIFCDGAEARVSGVGAGACRRGTGPDFGGWVKWNGDWTPYLWGCDLSEIKQYVDPGQAGPKYYPVDADGKPITSSASSGAAGPQARSAAGEPDPDNGRTFRIEPGQETAVVSVEGVGALPKFTLQEPGGRTIIYDGVDRENIEVDQANNVSIADSLQYHVANIAIGSPKAGKWLFTVDSGSVPVTGLTVGAGTPPELEADVTKEDGEYVLDYEGELEDGEQVRFTEDGASINGPIGSDAQASVSAAAGRDGKVSGEIPFEPAPGSSEKRDIVAFVTYADGRAGPRLVVGSYKAPPAPRPGPIKNLKLVRRGKVLTASFARDSDSDRYEVFFELANGKTRHSITTKTRVSMRRVPARTGARVTVTPMADGGVGGKPRVARVKRAPRR